MAEDVKSRMIREAAVLLSTKGLQGASFSEVLEASGAPRGSLYHHFPGGKNELVLAALKAAGEAGLSALAQEGRPASEVAQAFIGLWRGLLAHAEFRAGCAVLAVTVATDEPAQLEAAGAIFRTWRARLAELFAAGGVAAPRAESLAALLIATMEGGVALARAERAFAPFDAAAGEALAAIEAAQGRM